MGYEVHVLHTGYSGTTDQGMIANCSCTLIRGRHNVIVDTMTPWDKDRIISALALHKLTPDDIQYVVCTHGHSDHVGNNNLFLYAKHIVGYSVSFRDIYTLHPFEDGQPFVIDDDVKVIPTPGHTNTDVSVIVRTRDQGTVAIVGDLFEKEEDLKDSSIWRTLGGSENPRSQERYRNAILLIADYIVPGHGPMFSVTAAVREEANKKSTISTGQANYLPPSFIKSGFSFPSFSSYSEGTYGSKWVDDVSTKMDKFDLIGSSRLSPPRHSPSRVSPSRLSSRCWEDKLKDSDLHKRENKPESTWSCKPDLFGGQPHLDSKSLYDSGSRSLDARINFDDRARSPIMRENRAQNLDDYCPQGSRKYTSETMLYGGSTSSILKSKVDRDSERPLIPSSSRNFDSTKAVGSGDTFSIGGHGRFDRPIGDEPIKSTVGFSDYKTDPKYGMGKDLSFKENEKSGLKVSFGPLSKCDSKDKLCGNDKSGHALSYNQTFVSDVRKQEDRFGQEEKYDQFKLKHDLSGYNSVDKFRDEGKNEKFKWESRDTAVRDWGSLDRRAPTGEKLAADIKTKDLGETRMSMFSDSGLKGTVAHSSADSLVQRDDRFSRVII